MSVNCPASGTNSYKISNYSEHFKKCFLIAKTFFIITTGNFIILINFKFDPVHIWNR